MIWVHTNLLCTFFDAGAVVWACNLYMVIQIENLIESLINTRMCGAINLRITLTKGANYVTINA